MLRMQNGTIQFFDKKGKSFGLLTLTETDKPSILVQHNAGSFFINDDTANITHNKMIQLNAPQVLKNGVEITAGATGAAPGGGWSGTYPSIADTQAKKFAWEAWATLRGLGYSESASAGILGNINGEAGPSMNPDTDQVGGPAYGAVQFDGSAYPLIGSPTNDGREYFQRLHKASGVGGDYKTMSVQMAVVNWTMTNGQWIGQINPTSVSGYKSMTDARTAATVFERNFERPASTHPERSNYAQYWYDLFKGVTIEKNTWVNPMRVSYTVTQEWDQIGWGTGQIHGGIDLAPNGSVPPIYAARAGTVVQVVPNDPTG
ncbi:MAG: hypothetical protein H9W83_06735, partial [Leuconostoc sp.]|nr:hypothetical protein [Leuconostoc sp.]